MVVDSIMDDKQELDDGGPYADALIVRLPADTRKRLRLASIAGSESMNARRTGCGCRTGDIVLLVGLSSSWWFRAAASQV